MDTGGEGDRVRGGERREVAFSAAVTIDQDVKRRARQCAQRRSGVDSTTRQAVERTRGRGNHAVRTSVSPRKRPPHKCSHLRKCVKHQHHANGKSPLGVVLQTGSLPTTLLKGWMVLESIPAGRPSTATTNQHLRRNPGRRRTPWRASLASAPALLAPSCRRG